MGNESEEPIASKKSEDLPEVGIQQETPTRNLDTSKWPLLLKNYDKLNLRSGHYIPIQCGHTPLKKPLEEHFLYGVINLDQPPNASFWEVTAWLKRILRARVGRAFCFAATIDAGPMPPGSTGSLALALDRAGRLRRLRSPKTGTGSSCS
jgi:H/ACA ribonucleoprotein complex subunit 4